MAILSQTAEYALRAVVCMANHPGQSLTTRQLADHTRVPQGYLSKVMQHLSRAGLVVAQRGLHGGFSLNLAPEALSILEVINAVDRVHRIRECPLKLHGVNLCPLHRRIDDAMAYVEQAFADSTIAEMLEPPDGQQPLCKGPHTAVKADKKRTKSAKHKREAIR